ncbi:hypothetical protein ACFOMD_00810 [Sphingoaurantiacus capsulatus]|uniref:Uncharacterized protein n=1 Tax=Sphingoaurantiacus capsulatus TaxID=1771310 RepID=A0ABV7X8V3_9SPHN
MTGKGTGPSENDRLKPGSTETDPAASKVKSDTPGGSKDAAGDREQDTHS